MITNEHIKTIIQEPKNGWGMKEHSSTCTGREINAKRFSSTSRHITDQNAPEIDATISEMQFVYEMIRDRRAMRIKILALVHTLY